NLEVESVSDVPDTGGGSGLHGELHRDPIFGLARACHTSGTAPQSPRKRRHHEAEIDFHWHGRSLRGSGRAGRAGHHGGDVARRPYTNVQFAASRPHDELAIIVSSGENLEVAGDTMTGTLSDVGARLLLVHEGQENQIQPLTAAGTFKLQVANRLVTKYIV